MIQKTEGIVLKTFDFRETSRIAVFFTRDLGKMKGLLKGIRKDVKKFGSHVDKFSINEIVYYPSRQSEIHLISQCDLKQYFLPIRQDYKRNMAALYCLELVDAIMPLEQENHGVYQLMLDYFKSLESIQDIDKLVNIFQVKILSLSGFRPHIDACVKCSNQIAGKTCFSMVLGGLICSRCSSRDTAYSVISRGTIASILHVEKNDWPTSLKMGLTPSVKKELKQILNNFLMYHLEKRLKSVQYL